VYKAVITGSRRLLENRELRQSVNDSVKEFDRQVTNRLSQK